MGRVASKYPYISFKINGISERLFGFSSPCLSSHVFSMLLCACQIKLLFNRNVELEVLMEPRSQHRRAASQRAAEKGPCTQCACNLAAVSQSERQPPAQPNVGVKVKFLFHWMPADRGWMPLSSPLSPTHFQQCSSPIVGVAAWQVSKPALLWSRQCGNLLWALPQPGTAALRHGPLLSQELFWNEDSFPEKCSSKINIVTSCTHTEKTQRFHSCWHFLMRKKILMESDFLT